MRQAYCFKVKFFASHGDVQLPTPLCMGSLDSTATDMCWAHYCYGCGILSDHGIRVGDEDIDIAHGHRLNNSPGIDHVIIETQGVFGFIWCYIRQPHG